MQLRRPSNTPKSGDSSGYSAGPLPANTNWDKPKPGWLKDWIADKGRWALLKCGHKCDLNERGQILLEGEKKGDLLVICEKCWQIPKVARHLTYHEYRGIPAAVTPEEPLF